MVRIWPLSPHKWVANWFYTKGEEWLTFGHVRVSGVKFYWFSSDNLKYRNSTDFLQIGKTVLKNFMRFSMFLF